ncbi:MAG TPA: DUF2933 domain-containing protein [Rhodocyclaceae bacterium]|jgi:hypothetical protein
MANDSDKVRDSGQDHDHQHERRIAWGWWFFAAVALFYLLSEHRAHFFGVLPYLFLFACPLMHRFMHHGHHGSHRHPEQGKDGEDLK